MAHQTLTQEERYQISKGIAAGQSLRSIGSSLGRSAATTSRELRRNADAHGRYQHEQAHQLSDRRRRTARKASYRNAGWLPAVDNLLRLDLSPEQVSGSLKLCGISVSHEWIYQRVLRDQRAGGDLWLHLRHRHKRYRKRYGAQDRRGQIPDRIDIDQRPAIVEERSRLGDWEIDTVIGSGNSGVLVTAVERRSRLTRIGSCSRRTADEVVAELVRILRPLRAQVLTLTADNSKEFTRHAEVASQLQCEFYFAKPYRSWQRGLNETTNGLIRQYFPKGMDFSRINKKQIKTVETLLNRRPRKCLNYITPLDFFNSGVATVH